jgi:membrane protein
MASHLKCLTEPTTPAPRPTAPLGVFGFLREGLEGFIADNALTRGAAIAFYAVTAVVPVLFIATAIAGLVLGRNAASGAVNSQLRQIMSQQSADLVQLAILHVRGGAHSWTGNLIGIVAVVVTASGVFTEIEDALNTIWRAPRTESYFHQLLRGRVLSLVLVVGLGFLLILSMIVASLIGAAGHVLNRFTDLSLAVTGVANFALSFAVVALLFAAIYKILPNTRLYWRDVVVGACGTALLFQAGQAAIAFYLANFISANIYGAAAGVILLLIWVYYAAMILLLGAEFTKVWTFHYGIRRGQPRV